MVGLLGGLLNGLLGGSKGKGSLPKGSSSEITFILDLLAQLERVAAAGPSQISLTISIVQKLVSVLRKLSATLPLAKQKIILNIIQLLNQIVSLVKVGNTAGVKTTIEKIDILIE